MSVYSIPQALEERLGKAASEALAEMLRAMFDDERRDMLARIDEKVVGRYADIQRRGHEDVAGVELRITQKLVDVEARLTGFETKLAALEGRFDAKLAALEGRFDAKLAVLEGRVDARLAALEGRVDARLAALEGRLSEKISVQCARLETRFTRGIAEAKNAMIVWLVGALVVQSGLMVAVAWASKHLM